MRSPHAGMVIAALAASVAVWGCRCGKSEPGEIGKAATALEAIPGDVDALVVLDFEGLRQGAMWEHVLEPLVVVAFREWGGSPCEALPAEKIRSAAIGVRLPDAATGEARQFFVSAAGPSLGDVRACIDAHGAREGLGSALESVGRGRAVTDTRGLHVLGAGPDVVAFSFPFAKKEVLEKVVPVAFGEAPSADENPAFGEVLTLVEGDLTIALSDTRELFREYGGDLRERLGAAAPQDLCAEAAGVRSIVEAARTFGFGDLRGVGGAIDRWFPDAARICAADAVRRTFEEVSNVRAAIVGLSGREDIVITLALVFTDPTAGGALVALFADLLHVAAILPAKLDFLERLPIVGENIDVARVRQILRNPLLKHVSVGGEGVHLRIELRIEQGDIRPVVESLQGLAKTVVVQ